MFKKMQLLPLPAEWSATSLCVRLGQFCASRYASTNCEIPNGGGGETQRRRAAAGLRGKNWKELRKKQKMGHEKWEPAKRLTWYQIEHLKTLRRTQPEEWSKTKLAKQFGISILAVNRILRSKFEPTEETKQRQDALAMDQTAQRRRKFKLAMKNELYDVNLDSEKGVKKLTEE